MERCVSYLSVMFLHDILYYTECVSSTFSFPVKRKTCKYVLDVQALPFLSVTSDLCVGTKQHVLYVSSIFSFSLRARRKICMYALDVHAPPFLSVASDLCVDTKRHSRSLCGYIPDQRMSPSFPFRFRIRALSLLKLPSPLSQRHVLR